MENLPKKVKIKNFKYQREGVVWKDPTNNNISVYTHYTSPYVIATLIPTGKRRGEKLKLYKIRRKFPSNIDETKEYTMKECKQILVDAFIKFIENSIEL